MALAVVRACLPDAGSRVAVFWRLGRGCCLAGDLVCGDGGRCGLSAVWQVVAQAGTAPPRTAGGAGLVAAGEGPPGADLADVGGHEQQRGEQGAGGDAADAAAAGLGQGLVGGVFGVAVEAFDGVAQGGVAGVPGGAAVGQVLAVAGADAGAMVIAVWWQSLGGSGGGWRTLGRPSRGVSEAGRSGQVSPGWLPVAGQEKRW